MWEVEGGIMGLAWNFGHDGEIDGRPLRDA